MSLKCLHDWDNIVELHMQAEDAEARVLFCRKCDRHLFAHMESAAAKYPEAIYDMDWFARAGLIEYVPDGDLSRFKHNEQFCKYLRQPMNDALRLPQASERDFVYFINDDEQEQELYRPEPQHPKYG